MIEFRLVEIGRDRGIENGYQLMKALKGIGVEITPASAHKMWKGAGEREAITFDTLDYLCRVLDCTPCDLLVQTKKKKK